MEGSCRLLVNIGYSVFIKLEKLRVFLKNGEKIIFSGNIYLFKIGIKIVVIVF